MPDNDNAQADDAARVPTRLFAYGTLRHDQPEHARFCRGVTGWRRARMRGRLWRLPSGYLLLVVPPGDVLLYATLDSTADERAHAAVTRTVEPSVEEDVHIEGEVLFFRDAELAWPPLDRWEDFSPGSPGAYQRCIVPVRIHTGEDGGQEELTTAWAYVASEPPMGAYPL